MTRRRPFGFRLLLHDVAGEGERRSSRAENAHFRACSRPIPRRDDRVQRQAARYRVFRVTAKRAIPLGDARYLTQHFGVRVKIVEQVAGRGQKIHLVRRHEGALRERIGFDEGYDPAVHFGIIVQSAVDTLHLDLAQAQIPGPFRENAHDRRFRGSHPDKVKSRPDRRCQFFDIHQIPPAMSSTQAAEARAGASTADHFAL